MEYINRYAKEQDSCCAKPLQPHDIFQLVAGTSTGGLIAIMLGKLGLSVDECVGAYCDLSKQIFEKKHSGGKYSKGLAHAKYSGINMEQCTKNLIGRKGKDRDMAMCARAGQDRIVWWVSQ